MTGRPGGHSKELQEFENPIFWIALHSPQDQASVLTAPTPAPANGDPCSGAKKGNLGRWGLLCILCSLARMGCMLRLSHGPLQTPVKWVQRGHYSTSPKPRRGRGERRCHQSNWPWLSPGEMEKLRPAGSTSEPLTAAAGEVGLSEDSRAPEAEERGGMGQSASHPWAGPARVSAQAPARSPPQVRAGSKRHLLDCSVRCRTTEVKAPRPCGERAARRKAYSVLGFRSSTTKAVAGSKVLATWGRGEERDPDGERARQRQTGRQTQTESDGDGEKRGGKCSKGQGKEKEEERDSGTESARQESRPERVLGEGRWDECHPLPNATHAPLCRGRLPGRGARI